MAVRLPLMGNFENSVLRPAGSDTVLPQSDRPTALALEVRVAAVRCRLQGRARAALPSSAPDPCSVENDLVVSARTVPPLPNAQNHRTTILVGAIFFATPPIFNFFSTRPCVLCPPLRPLSRQKKRPLLFPNPPVLNLNFKLPRLLSSSCVRTLPYFFPQLLGFLLVCFTLRVYVCFYACMCVMPICLRWPCLCVCAKICVCGEGCLSNQSYRMCFAKKMSDSVRILSHVIVIASEWVTKNKIMENEQHYLFVIIVQKNNTEKHKLAAMMRMRTPCAVVHACLGIFASASTPKCLSPCAIMPRGFTSLQKKEAEYSFSGFIPTNKTKQNKKPSCPPPNFAAMKHPRRRVLLC